MNEKLKYGVNVMIKGHRCYRCSFEWRPKNSDVIPKVCPKCKNEYWKTPVSRKNISELAKKQIRKNFNLK